MIPIGPCKFLSIGHCLNIISKCEMVLVNGFWATPEYDCNNRLNMLGSMRHFPPFKVSCPCGYTACISVQSAKYPTLHQNVIPSLLCVHCGSLQTLKITAFCGDQRSGFADSNPCSQCQILSVEGYFNPTIANLFSRICSLLCSGRILHSLFTLI